MAQNGKKEPAEVILLPEGRLINSSLFEKDSFEVNGKMTDPRYKVELAFEPGQLNEVEDKLAEACVFEWGMGADALYDSGQIESPIKNGDDMAARREANGKPGDAYKGKDVIRADTKYNKFGQDGPGGVAVFAPDVSEITAANQQEIYAGIFGQAAVTIFPYLDAKGKKALKFYLSAFQKTRDGERLQSARDFSQVFKPVGRAAGEPMQRRRRAG